MLFRSSEGLKEVFDDISPIADYSGHLSLEFVDFTLCEDDVKSVSYTHLDVYKRQGCNSLQGKITGDRRVKDARLKRSILRGSYEHDRRNCKKYGR